ncbi:MAG: hypothetical protein ACRC6U_00840 [Fusobacteriaceae bacterium]
MRGKNRSIYIDDTLFEWLKEEAEAEKVTVSKLITKTMYEYFKTAMEETEEFPY